MTRISRPRAFLLCAIPELTTVLLAPTTVVPASSGRAPGEPAGTSAMESPLEPGVPALFSWADYDGDGRLDIAAVTADGALRPLLNACEGRFKDVTERVGLFDIDKAALALWADYDGDGRLDLFVGAREGASRLFHNDYGDDLAEQERRILHAAIKRGWHSLEQGKGVRGDDVIRELRAR